MLLFSFFFTLIVFLFISNKNHNVRLLWVLIIFSLFLSTSILGNITIANILINEKFLSSKIYFLPYFITLLLSLYVIYLINKEKTVFFKSNLSVLLDSYGKIPKSLKLYLILIAVSSIGPINHPDASDYHVGAAFQFFLHGIEFKKDFLSLGVTGAGDWINLLFLYENNTWFIRAINGGFIFIPVICYLYEKGINYWVIIIFLSMPVIIQWISIGKSMFIVEITLAILLLHFLETRNKKSITKLLYASIFSLSFKISSLASLICILFSFLLRLKLSISLLSKLNLINFLILILVLILSSLIFYLRYDWFSNPTFPMLTSFFNPNDNQLITFTESIREYKKDIWYWPIRIFIPLQISDVMFSTGPVFLSFVIVNIFLNFKNQDSRHLIIVSLLSIFLILLFVQPRGDLFAFSFILLVASSLPLKDFYFKYFSNRYVKFSIFLQVIVSILILLTNFFQNIYAIFDYENAMKKFSNGYHISQIAKQLNEPVLINFRQPRLFLDMDFIDIDVFSRCLNKNDVELCIKKFQIKSLIFDVGDDTFRIIQNKSWECDNKNVYIGYRNIINYKQSRKIKICERE